MGKKTKAIDRSARFDILTTSRNLKMASSAHAYVRGNTAKFYEWLTHTHKNVPVGPEIWICGDCHVGNLGPIADVEGRVDVQIRDLDQTVIGNPAHDLIRLGLSLASAARGSDLPGIATARILEAMVAGYRLALVEGPDDDTVTRESVPEPSVVRTVRRKALSRKWRDLAAERFNDARLAIPRGNKFWDVDEREAKGIDALFKDDAFAARIASWRGESRIRVIDKAYWMKGCSSLGNLRYAVLIASENDDGATFHLIDIKEAMKAAAPQAQKAAMPKDHAERVVEGARALSPHLGERMAAARLLDRPVIVRELAPQDLKLEIGQFSRSEAIEAARYLAFVVGKAHARQMDDAARKDWAKLTNRQTEDLRAPSWLWRAVVDLMGTHEVAYLEHCRAFGLADA